MNSPVILISEADIVGNKGAVAMVNCIVYGLRNYFPEAKFIITSKFITDTNYSKDPKIEILNDAEQKIDIPLVKVWIWWLFKHIGIKLNFLLSGNVIKKYLEADLVLSASGISFNDNFGLIKIYHFSKYLQLPIFLNKRVIKFTQTLGPFQSNYNKILAKLSLNQIDLVMARGRHSVENLKGINISENVKVFPDIALTMESKPSTKANSILFNCNKKIIIGISPNIVCKRLDKTGQYISKLKALCQHIIKQYKNVYFLFIPHTIEKSNLNQNDDYNICIELSSYIDNNEINQVVNTIDYSPEEIKWLISKCDFYIGSRFHALIASISSCVPSIAIGWHWKYNEMMEWAELENNVIQYWELTEKKLLKMFDDNFTSRVEIKEKLSKVVPVIKNKANKAIEYIAGVINETS